MNLKKRSSSFLRNVLTLGSGTAVAHLLLFLVTPLLTRLYAPNDWGTYAVFLSVASVFMALSSGKLEMGVVLPEKDEESMGLLLSSWVTHILCSGAYYVLLLILLVAIPSIMNNFLHWTLLAIVPIFGALQLLFESLKQWALRQEAWGAISTSNLMKAIATVLLQLVLAFTLGSHAIALIVALIVSLLFGNTWLWKIFKKTYLDQKSSFKWKTYQQILKKYKKFPLFTSPSILFNALVVQLPVWALTRLSMSMVGFYNLADRIIQAPLLLVGHSVGQVFYRNATKIKEDTEQLKFLTWKVFRALFYVIIIPAMVLSYWGAPIFAWVFGASWFQAGMIAGFLAPQLVFNFCVAPISNLWYTFNRNQNGIYFQIILFFGRLILIVLFGQQILGMDELFMGLGYFGAMVYGILGFLFLQKLGLSWIKYLLQIVLPFMIVFIGLKCL